MSIIVSGSICYDRIMDFPDSFKNHILPDHIHILNVSFTVTTLKNNFGGTGGNIAYTIALLEETALPVGTLGNDAQPYIAHLKKHNISTTHVQVVEETPTATAHITTDKDDNQITAFFVGAMMHADNLSLHDVSEKAALTIISPNKKEAMIRHSKESKERDIPIVFDPGQQTISFNKQELLLMIGQADYIIGNDYEMKLIQDKTGWDTKELLNHAKAVIVTLGERGSTIITKEETVTIDSCPVSSVEDPTGAGDAYRAGFFTAFTQGLDWKTCGQTGAVAAAYAIEHYGTQNHTFTKEEFSQRYKETYNQELRLEAL